MEFLGYLLLGLLLVSSAFANVHASHGHGKLPRVYGLHCINRKAEPIGPSYEIDKLNRSSFPKGFIFEAASSTYQVEDAWNVNDKGPSNWDYFTRKYPGGKLSGGVNEKGIKYYNDLINYSTRLQDLALLQPNRMKDSYDFADICCKRFGDRVKHWITFNKPWNFSSSGYDIRTFPPGRCSSWMNNNCTSGNSGTEPYVLSHNQILGHAAAVKLYETKYQAHQKGIIGITLVSTWTVPISNSLANRQAAVRQLDFTQRLVGSCLPKFTFEQAKQVKGSCDFIGLNYYTAFLRE